MASDKTSILGWSAGAELVTRSIAAAPPDTFKAAISSKGAHDTLRVSIFIPSVPGVPILCIFRQFPQFHPGVYWIGALGDPDQPADFDYMYHLASLYQFPSDKPLPDTLLLAGGSKIHYIIPCVE